MEFKVIRNDIVNMDVDAIVLPANPSLKEGPGASKAIYQAAGRKQLTTACTKLTKEKGKIKVGTAVPTLGYDLDATYIIHAVVPRWRDGHSNEYELLSSAYCSVLKLADILGCSSLAIPLLASGNNKFDLDLAIEIAKKSIETFEAENKLTDVFLVVYGMNAADKIRKMGIPFEEVINEAYVMKKDEEKNPNVVKAKRTAKHVAKKYLEEALNEALDYITDPKTIAKFIKAGVKIAKDIIQ